MSKMYLKEMKMKSVEEYKTVSDVISDLNVMIVEAPITNDIRVQLADIVGGLVEAYGVDEDGEFIYSLTDGGKDIEDE
jgi:hypothetical protein